MATNKTEPAKQGLAETLNAINFKNAQVERIKSMQEGKERLKDRMGRNKKRYVSSVDGSGSVNRRIGAAGRIKGLQTL